MAKGIDLGTGWINVVPSFSGMNKAISKELGAGFSEATRSMSGGMGNIGTSIAESVGGGFAKIGKIGLGTIGGLGAAVAGLAATGGLTRAMNIQEAKAQLKGLGHSTATIGTIMDNALASVKGTAFGLGEAAKVAASAVASGIKPGTELEKVLKTVADTATIAGADMGSMGAIFNKVAASGKAQMDVFNQLSDAGVPALQLVADHLGITAEETAKLASAGKIDFATFQAAMEAGMGGAALESANTLKGAFANLRAALSRTGESFAGLQIEPVTRLIKILTGTVDALTTQFKPLAETLNKHISPFFEKLVGHAADAENGIEETTGILQEFNKKLAEGSITLVDIGTKIGTVVGGFGALAGAGSLLANGNFVSGISTFGSSIDGLAGKVSGTFSKMTENVKGFPSSFGTFASSVKGKLGDVKTAFGEFGGSLGMVWESVIPDSVQSKLSGFADTVTGKLGTVKNFVSSVASDVAGRMSALGSSIVSNFKDRIPAGLTSAVGAVKSKVGEIGSAFGLVGDRLGNLGSTISSAMGTAFEPIKGFAGKVSSIFSVGNLGKMFAFGALGGALIAGLGAILSQGGDTMVTEMMNKATELINKIPEIINDITAQLPQFMQVGMQAVETIANALITNLPTIIQSGIQLLTSLATGLAQQLPTLIPLAIQAIMTIVTGLLQNLPAIIDAGLQVLTGLIEGIVASIPMLIEMAPTIIQSLLDTLVGKLPEILETGATLLESLIDGLVNAIPQLIETIVALIPTIVTTLVSNLPRIIEAGITLLVTLVGGIIQAIPQLVQAIPQIISAFVNAIGSNFPKILETGKQILQKLKDGIGNAFEALKDVGRNIVQGLIDGVTGMFGRVKSKFQELTSFLPDWKGPASVDRVLLVKPARLIMGGFADEIADYGFSEVKNTLGMLTNKIPSMVGNVRIPFDVNSQIDQAITVPVDIQRPPSFDFLNNMQSTQGVTFNIGAINNPLAEPSSTTLNRELQKIGAGTGLF